MTLKPPITIITTQASSEPSLDVKPCSKSTTTVQIEQPLKAKQCKPLSDDAVVNDDADDVKSLKSNDSKGINKNKSKRRKGYSINGIRLGRPKNEVVKAKKNPVGRPKNDTGIMAEYKQRMLASPKSVKVLEAVMNTASDPEHKNFTACAKLVFDRMLPVSSFDSKEHVGKASISITITNIDGSLTKIGSEVDALEAEYEEVNPDKG